jgi:hypothetical protein
MSPRVTVLTALLPLLAACTESPVATCGSTDPVNCGGDALLAKGPADPLAKANPLPPELEQQVRTLRATLEDDGYEVARGYWFLFTNDDCKQPIRTMGNCYGNNPAAPYIAAAVPRWKDEHIDRQLHLVLGARQRSMSAMFRMDEREALVIAALLPPDGAYFGLQSYVFSRQGAINEADPIYTSLATFPDVRDLLFAMTPDPERPLVFASLGNSINNVVVQQQSQGSFGTQRFFIITPDGAMERAMKEALLASGVPTADDIFTEPLSTDLVRIGLGPEADDLLVLFRYAMPTDSLAGEAWRQRLPLAVLRVRDMRTDRATEPYAVPAYEARLAISDTALARDVDSLKAAVKRHWGQPGAPVLPFINAFTRVDLVGQHCLLRPMNCLGDTQDTDTYRISPPLTLDAGEVIALVSPLATATGNATYVSLGVNRAEVLMAVANVSNHQLDGTATAFASTVNNAGKLYLWYLARDCSGLSNCTTVTEALVPRGETIKIMQRNYMFPGSRRGPDATKLLSPWAIVLDGAERP